MAASSKRPGAHLVAESEAMQRVQAQIDHLAGSSEPVLIEGEPGSGRELVARIIHLSSPRKHVELVAFSAAGTPRELDDRPIDGADVVKSARGGALLVKGVCGLAPAQQRRLARLVADHRRAGKGEGVRLLATADPGLDAAVDAELFHKPLFASLAKNTITVPPLRERVTDIAPLMGQLVRELGREIGRRRVSVSTRAYDRLVSYPWPGNVAELKQVARRLVIGARGSRIDAAAVDAVLPVMGNRVPLEDMSFEEMVRIKLVGFLRRMGDYPIDNFYDDVIGRVERELFDLVMEHTGQNQLKAAEILGVSRNTLRRKLGPKTQSKSTRPRSAPSAAKTGKRKPTKAG